MYYMYVHYIRLKLQTVQDQSNRAFSLAAQSAPVYSLCFVRISFVQCFCQKTEKENRKEKEEVKFGRRLRRLGQLKI